MDRKPDERIKKELFQLKNILKNKFEIKKMFLFGSRARGDYFLDSDVDVVIVSNYFKDKRFSSRISEILKIWENDINIEPLCYTPEEFEEKSKQIGIVQEALKEGIEI